MTIFNSLGSNYNFRFVIKSLIASNSASHKKELKKFLETKYGGEVTLLYKGREAIKLAIQTMNLPKGSFIGITGFTCYVVYQAVVETGCTPIFLDIEKEDLNFRISELDKHKNLKALIIQNTLGNPCQIDEIKRFCKRNDIFLIEDLAHSIGLKYENGKDVGTCGDFTALSFSQDKMVDSISGGALIIRNIDFRGKNSETILNDISPKQQIVDRFYPLFTFLIRNLYIFGLGKVLHLFLKRLNLLSQPVEGNKNIRFHSLPNWYCSLIGDRFSRLDNEIRHRESIAKIYKNKIQDNLGLLRFPIFIKDRQGLISSMKDGGVYISDIWYDAPIAPARFLKQTNYKGECNVSEEVSNQIINLPTHINISINEAEAVSEKINIWINSQ